MNIPYHLTINEEIFFVLKNKPYTFKSDDLKFSQIVEYVSNNKLEELEELLNKPQDLVVATNGLFQCTENGHVYYGKSLLSSQTADLIYNRLVERTERDAWYKMLGKIAENPRADIMHEIILWIEAAKLAIFDDGDILAFKRVRSNYTSFHDSRTLNLVGTTIRMNRENCNPNRNDTCSSGLHFCSYGYLDKFASSADSKTLILKLNPKDIVAIPYDYNNQKGRACSYYIWGEVGQETPTAYSEENQETVSATNPVEETQKEITDQAIRKAYEKHGSYTAAGASLGMSRKQFTRRYKKLETVG